MTERPPKQAWINEEKTTAKDKISGKEMSNVLKDDTTKTSLREKLIQHGENSNIHGISHILSRKTVFRKFLWIISFFGLSAFVVYQLYNIISLYTSYPTQTNMELNFKPLAFPAITICNMNPIRRSHAQYLNLPLLTKILNGENISDELVARRNDFKHIYDYEYIMYDYHGGAYVNYPDETNDTTNEDVEISDAYLKKELFLQEISKLSWWDRFYSGHQYDEMIMECEFRGGTCPGFSNVFISDDYGNCFTIQSSDIVAGVAGLSTGISLTVNLETYDAGDITEGYGLVVMLHEPGVYPLPSEDGTIVSGGSETHMKMKLQKIKRQGEPYGKCNNLPKSNTKATIHGCLNECLNKYYEETCNCQMNPIKFNTTKGQNATRYCKGQVTDLKCSKETYRQLIRDIDSICACRPPCRENVYMTTVSSHQWPRLEHQKKITDQICEEFSAVDDMCPISDDKNVSTASLENNFLKLIIYYGDLNHQVITEEPVYTWTRLLSDVGGSLGLCVGVSLLCICEVIEVVLDIALVVIKKVFRR